MTEQERINLETRLRFELQDEKFERVIAELKEQREDIRRAQDKHAADMRKMDAKFDALFKQMHNNFVQTMLGVGAIMAAIGGLIIAVLK